MAALTLTCSLFSEAPDAPEDGAPGLSNKKNDHDAESPQRKSFDKLNDFLQPGSKLSVEQVTDELLLMLPAHKDGREEYGLCDMIVELSEQTLITTCRS